MAKHIPLAGMGTGVSQVVGILHEERRAALSSLFLIPPFHIKEEYDGQSTKITWYSVS